MYVESAEYKVGRERRPAGVERREKKFFVNPENCQALEPRWDDESLVWKKLGQPPELSFSEGVVFDGTDEERRRLRESGLRNTEGLRSGDMVACYPKGDYFLSLATALRALGGILQEKFNARLAGERNEEKRYARKEMDAGERGLALFKEHCRGLYTRVERDFNEARRAGGMSDFKSFEEFYRFAHAGDLTRKISEVVNSTRRYAAESAEPEKQQAKKIRREWEGLARQKMISADFDRLNKARCGKKIDEELVKEIFSGVGNAIGEEVK